MIAYKDLASIPVDKLKNDVVIQCMETHQYFTLPDVDTTEAYICSFISATRYYSEVGVSVGDFARPLKLFIDFDWKPETKTYVSSTDIFSNILLPALLEFMHKKEELQLTVKASDFILFPMDAPDKSKISFHCVMNNGLYFPTMTDQRLFMTHFVQYVKETRPDDSHLNKYAKLIDFARYSMNPKTSGGAGGEEKRGVFFQLRAPLCAKDGRKKQIPKGLSFGQCLVLHYGDGPVTYIQGSPKAPKVIRSAGSAIQYMSKNNFFWVPENLDEATELLEKVCPYDHSCIEITSRKPFNHKGIVEFRRKTNANEIPAKCSICKGDKPWHKSKLPYAYLSDLSIDMKCFSNKEKGQIYPSIRIPIKYTTTKRNNTVKENRIVILQGKVICMQYGCAILKSSNSTLVCLKGSAVIEMICPLFYWTVHGVKEKDSTGFEGAQLETYHLSRVISVRPLCLKKDTKWTRDSWRSFPLTSVKNCFSDIKHKGSQSSYLYYKDHRNDPLKTFIQNHDQELRNIWLTEQGLLRLCNDYPDTLRVGQPISEEASGVGVGPYRLIDCNLIHNTPIFFEQCSDLFGSVSAFTSMMKNIVISPRYIEFIKSAPDYNKDIHDRMIEMALFYQKRLHDVYRTDSVVPVVIDTIEQRTQISQFYSTYDDMMTALVYTPKQSTKFDLKIAPDATVMVFFMREYIDTFLKMLTIFTSSTLKLVEDLEITDRPATTTSKWVKTTDGKYLFPKIEKGSALISDTVLFINDTLTNQEPCRFNPHHAWNHLRVLWAYRTAYLNGDLVQWKKEQLKSVKNVFTDPLFEGSLFYLLLFTYDNPPS